MIGNRFRSAFFAILAMTALHCTNHALSDHKPDHKKVALATIKNVQSRNKFRVVTFTNNLTEATDLLDMPEDRLRALEQLARKSTLSINGVVIPADASVILPVQNNQCTISITISAQDCGPFFNPSGFFRAAAYFVEVELTFVYTLDSTENKLQVLLPLIRKIEQWEKQMPSAHLSYRFPLTAKLIISDFSGK